MVEAELATEGTFFNGGNWEGGFEEVEGGATTGEETGHRRRLDQPIVAIHYGEGSKSKGDENKLSAPGHVGPWENE